MSMAIPALVRLGEMRQLVRASLAYELLAGMVAVRMRGQRPGDGVASVLAHFEPLIAPYTRDRAPAADVETILEQFSVDAFAALLR